MPALRVNGALNAGIEATISQGARRNWPPLQVRYWDVIFATPKIISKRNVIFSGAASVLIYSGRRDWQIFQSFVTVAGQIPTLVLNVEYVLPRFIPRAGLGQGPTGSGTLT